MSLLDVVRAIDKALPKRRPIGHHETKLELQYTSSLCGDPWVARVADRLAAQCGVTGVVCTNSGTSALHLALLALGVKSNEEVIVPSMTFVATANAVRYVGAYPNFLDGQVTVSAYKLRRYLELNTKPTEDKRGRLNTATGRVISAVIVVDLLGFPADLPRLEQAAEEFGLRLIEDASQALGSKIGNRQCGSFGSAAILSFNNNKIVTGFGGGALLTNVEWVAAKANQLGTTAKVLHPWRIEHDAVAYNYRMSDLSAMAIHIQLEQLGTSLRSKKQLHTHYAAALKGCDEVSVLTAAEPWQGQPNYWLTTLRLKPWIKKDLTATMENFHKRGIGVRALFTPLHTLSQFADCPRADRMVQSVELFQSAICLPSGLGLINEISSGDGQQS